MKIPHLLPLTLACLAAPLHAQVRPGLLQVAATPDGTVLSLDSASIGRIGQSAYSVTAVYQYSPELARQYGFDRLLEDQELDCAGMRVRDSRKRAFAGDQPMEIADRDSASSPEWMAASAAELPLVQAICGTLLSSFATTLPVTFELRDVETQPMLVNRSDVLRSLERNYPALLRDAGITGTATVRIRITAEGRVDSGAVQVESATHDTFGAAAERVVLAMRFSPALVGGQAVAVWATLPVSFQLAGRYRRQAEAEPEPDRPVNPGFIHRPRASPSVCTLPPPLCGGAP